MRRVRRVVVALSVAVFIALWGVVYATVRSGESLASPSTASPAQTSGDTSTSSGDASSAQAPSQTPSQTQLPPASTSQS
ncbi:hypothetical protein [Capillimicrobium parvum]|uniref:Uncharacterized protein n=1 Tax=Capillimicrobium parvum TaxID=2884022 RepID=A0A9E6XV62_9ACTN|nr:hypothetical protein [Capillimicrobium parvum]UGS34356.1 hypothetical protein DSM104329_00733 [Capillimicrobium parvum]